MTSLASIIAIVQLTGTIINICYDYQKGVRKAHKDQAAITKELKSLHAVLERLLELAESESDKGSARLSTFDSLTKPDGPLAECEAELISLKEKLEPASGWKAVGKALTWPLKEGDTRKILDKLERLKGTLNLALTAD